jgi:hypothetical protein
VYWSNTRYTEHIRSITKNSGDSVFTTYSFGTGHSKGRIEKSEIHTSIKGKLENICSSRSK